MDTRTVYLILHGKTPYYTRTRALGHLNVSIADEGRADIIRVAHALRGVHFDAIYASDLARTYQSANIVKDIVGVASVHRSSKLRGVDLGAMTGFDRNVVNAARNPDMRTRPMLWGESYDEMQARVVPFISGILQEHVCSLIVTHPDCIRAWIAHVRGIPLESYLDTALPQDVIVRCKQEAGVRTCEIIQPSARDRYSLSAP